MMRLISIIACIAVGGGFGALAREGTMTLMHGTVGLPAYVSLGIVNVVGSLLIGIIFSRMESSLNRNGGSRLQHLPHAKRLQHLPWWPDGDPTLPAVDILRFETSLQIGSALLTRTPRGSTLTESGALVAGWAAEVLAAAERLDAGIASLRSDAARQLKVAASQTIAEHLLPLWLAESVKAGETDSVRRSV